MTSPPAPGDRHHYVPQFYLRRFARNSQLMLLRSSDGVHRGEAVRNTAMIYDFYSAPGHMEDRGVLEAAFSPIERRADWLFRRIASGE